MTLWEIVLVALKVIIVIGGGAGLFYLADRIKWPAPVGPWAMVFIGIVLLIGVVWLLLTWAFGVAVPAV